jgi:hypothetical protein
MDRTPDTDASVGATERMWRSPGLKGRGATKRRHTPHPYRNRAHPHILDPPLITIHAGHGKAVPSPCTACSQALGTR